MTDARDSILARLRAARVDSRPEPSVPVRRFSWSRRETVERFRIGLESVRAQVHRVDDDWPRMLATRLRESKVKNLRYGPDGPLGEELRAGWPTDGPELIAHDQPIEACREALFTNTDAGFTSCLGGIAETGSLVLWPSRAEPRLLSLVPPVHVVLIEADRIVPTLHAMMSEQRWSESMPTNALLISGPSKSADIEQTLAYGVHGPEKLIVLIRGEDRPTGDRFAGQPEAID
ncbi:LutC/YkgG family protein [Thiocystis violacea]|uniref:LutC/YkgG family protein n=1 Tax=Thiocystis violacea TaxID=13725 RepID=UPI0019050EF6|nr:lactate utilization protein [Thiocystis violacea]MBK1718789.1 hypothetical protein [Thiocystis violacea]